MLKKVLPSAVKEIKELNGEDETRLNVDYNQIIGLLVESIKELKQEIKELKGDKLVPLQTSGQISLDDIHVEAGELQEQLVI